MVDRLTENTWMNGTSSTPNPGDETIDPGVWAELQQLMGSEAEQVLAELIDSYIEDTARQLALIEAAGRSRDRVGLARAIHTLRSPSASLGALRLATLCSDLEAHLRGDATAGNWPDERLDTLLSEADRAMAALKALDPRHGRHS